MLETTIILFFPFLMLLAATSDIFSMTIPNKISLALIIGFVICAYGVGLSWEQLGWHFALFGVVLFGGFTLFALGFIGGGDAKLAACSALWLGWENTFEYLLIASVMGGFLTFFILKVRGMNVLPTWLVKQSWAQKLLSSSSGVPYGAALGPAALFVYPSTIWMQHIFEQARII